MTFDGAVSLVHLPSVSYQSVSYSPRCSLYTPSLPTFIYSQAYDNHTEDMQHAILVKNICEQAHMVLHTAAALPLINELSNDAVVAGMAQPAASYVVKYMDPNR